MMWMSGGWASDSAQATSPAPGMTRMRGGWGSETECARARHASSLAAARPHPSLPPPPSQSSVTHLSTWGSSLSSRHLSHRPQAVPSNPGSARLTSTLHSETATERRKRATVRLRRGWVEAQVGRATQPAHGTITMCTSGAERETASESGGNTQPAHGTITMCTSGGPKGESTDSCAL